MSWTDDRVEQLKKLWMDGLSASQIALELGGVTRNAVIGKVHRLGLSGRAKGTNHIPATRQKRPQRTSFPKQPTRTTQRPLLASQIKLVAEACPGREPAPVMLTAPEPLRLELIHLTERTCKWPMGDPAQEDFFFCGHTSPEASPYCAYHSRLAYQAPPERKRDRRIEPGY